MNLKLSNLLLIVLFAFSFQTVLVAQSNQIPRPSSVAPKVLTSNAAFQGTTAPANQAAKWYPYLITRPTDRQWIESLPIHERPNRTFHIYGNAVRAGLLPHGPIGRMIFGN